MAEKIVSCPVCGYNHSKMSFSFGDYQYLFCNSCGLLYLSREILADAKFNNYSAGYFEPALTDNLSGYMDYSGQSKALRSNFRRYLSRISRHMLLKHSLCALDVGCAYGFLLDEARELGLSVHGIDRSPAAIEWMQTHLKISGTVGAISDAPPGPFDLITVSEVIEHIPTPGAFMDEVYKRLKAGGILLIATGANDSPIARRLGRWWWYLNPPDHCTIFSRNALAQLATAAGFEILEHRLFPFHWVGINNGMMKIARVLRKKWLGRIAARLPSAMIPIPHYTTQVLIAKKT